MVNFSFMDCCLLQHSVGDCLYLYVYLQDEAGRGLIKSRNVQCSTMFALQERKKDEEKWNGREKRKKRLSGFRHADEVNIERESSYCIAQQHFLLQFSTFLIFARKIFDSRLLGNQLRYFVV